MVGVDCRRKNWIGKITGVRGSTSTHEDVDVRGTVKNVFLKTTSTIADAVSVHVHHELGAQEGEKSEVVLHCSNQRFSSPIALQINPSSKGSERVILSAT